MPSQQTQATARGPGEPLSQRLRDPAKIRTASGHRNHRDPERLANGVQVEDIEPPDHRSVHEDGSYPLGRPEASEKGDYADGRIGPVDPDPTDANRLQLFGGRDEHGRDRSVPVSPAERAVVDGRDPGMALAEGPP